MNKEICLACWSTALCCVVTYVEGRLQVQRMEGLDSVMLETGTNLAAIGTALTNVLGWLPAPGLGATAPSQGAGVRTSSAGAGSRECWPHSRNLITTTHGLHLALCVVSARCVLILSVQGHPKR